MTAPRLLPAGDAALTVEFGDRVDPALNAQVLALDAALQADPFDGLVETMPTFRSLLVRFAPLAVDPETVRAAIRDALARLERDATATADAARIWRFPIAYGGENGPDLADVAARAGFTEQEVARRHAEAEHVVYMLGFLPGAPFLGGLPPEIDLPRRTAPRLAVPARSVALAVGLSVIYPVESPGGWNLIGRTPARLFDPEAPEPALLRPGDRIRFAPVAAEEAARLAERAERGDWRPELAS